MRWEQIKPYAGRIVGAAFGLLAGVIFLTTGFWKMLLFVAIVSIGYYFGKKSDQGDSWIRPSWKAWMLETGHRLKKRWEHYRKERDRAKWR